jgi:hypothetical protein
MEAISYLYDVTRGTMTRAVQTRLVRLGLK